MTPKPATFAVRDAEPCNGWMAIDQTAVDDLGVPRTSVWAVLSPDDFAALKRALGQHTVQQINAQAAAAGELCGAKPSKASTARCENREPCYGKPHSGRTTGGRWKHWTEPTSRS